jgi:hypothetical protein
MDFLVSETLVSEEVTYKTDEDGNIQLIQGFECITLTQSQQVAVASLLQASIDTFNVKINK